MDPAMLNRVILIGRLVRDPEQRHTNTNVPVTTFTLAVDRPFSNQQGERAADFIDIVTWRRLAEICAQNLKKGRLVAVEGRLQIRSYDDRNGIRRKAAEVVADDVRFLDSKGAGAGGPGGFGGEDAEAMPDEDLGADDFGDTSDVPF